MCQECQSFSGYYHLGNMYFVLEDYSSAEKYYMQALHYNPDDEKTMVDLGNIYNLTDRYEQSVESCNRAIKVNPEYGPAYEELGYAYLSMGNSEWLWKTISGSSV